MQERQKEEIRERLGAFVKLHGSITKAATAISANKATLSKMMGGKWENISDDKWRSVEAAIGAKHNADGWQVAETRAYKQMTQVLQRSKADHLVVAVTGDAGCGKTESIKDFCQRQREAYHLSCSEYWNKRTMLNKLLTAMGTDGSGMSVSELMEEIVDTLKKRKSPIIILDEADKLSDHLLYFFISLYNQLEDHCAIILCATAYLEKRIRQGLRSHKKGYEEIFSRIGRRFIALAPVNDEDIYAVCSLNGITDMKMADKIAEDSECDLRRVKRAVWAYVQTVIAQELMTAEDGTEGGDEDENADV